MSHTAEEWTDRFGRPHTSCGECEDAWPCRESGLKPRGWLVPGYVDAAAAIEAVAHGFGVSVDDIVGPSQSPHIFTARACAMAVLRENTTLSYPAIGKLFGRDHSTVMSAVQKVMGDPELAAGVSAVVAELRPPARLFAVPEAL